MRLLLRIRRKELGLTQQQAADYIGINKSTYGNYEHKSISTNSKYAQKIIKSGFLGTVEESKIRERLEEEHRRERNKHRIPNIPDFYERLDALCNERGNLRVEKDNKELIELQKDLGIYKERVYEPGSKGERARFADLLKEYRGYTTKRAFSKMLGISNSNYYNLEAGNRSSKSRDMQRLLTSNMFSQHQQRQLQEVYNRMQKKEAEEE